MLTPTVCCVAGVPTGAVSDWLHLHSQSDLVEVPCESVEVMPMEDGLTPYWLRVRLEGREQPVDLHSQWSSIGPDGAYTELAPPTWREVANTALNTALEHLAALDGDEKALAAIEAPAEVSRHNIAAVWVAFSIWVAFFSRRQRYYC